MKIRMDCTTSSCPHQNVVSEQHVATGKAGPLPVTVDPIEYNILSEPLGGVQYPTLPTE